MTLRWRSYVFVLVRRSYFGLPLGRAGAPLHSQPSNLEAAHQDEPIVVATTQRMRWRQRSAVAVVRCRLLAQALPPPVHFG